jgi:DNA modification methylase
MAKSPLPAAPPAAGRYEYWPIAKLKRFKGNAKIHPEAQVDDLARSIERFGFVMPILIRESGEIIAGHGRLDAAVRLGMAAVPVIVNDALTPDQARAYRIADNKLSEGGIWDQELLARELQQLEVAFADEGSLAAVLGFDQEELALLLSTVTRTKDETDPKTPNAAPEPPAAPVSRVGDLWVLGRHRLLVGDALLSSTIPTLLGTLKADLVITDPPYNVDYPGYTEEELTIEGDKMSLAEFKQFLARTFEQYRRMMRRTASIYVFHPSSYQREFENALVRSGFTVRCQIIWAKNTFAWGHGRYKSQHEPCFFAYQNGEKDRWYGDKSQSTLWQFPKPAANRLHPAAKPVELIEHAMLNSSRPDDIVLDLFGGSGSTLIAAERQGRVCRLAELDPKYADGIIKRWQDLSGREALLTDGAQTFADVESARLTA